MKTFAFLFENTIQEIIAPVSYTEDSPEGIEPPWKAGDDIPLELRYHPDFVAQCVDITDRLPTPQVGWITEDEGATFIEPSPPPVEPPQQVSSAQLGVYLIQKNTMDAWQEAIDAADTPADIKWAWRRASSWDRASPTIEYLANKLQVSSSEMDAIFTEASKLNV